MTALLERLRRSIARLAGTSANATPLQPDATAEPPTEAHAAPRIEPGSTLDTMSALTPATATRYADAVLADIEHCVATTRLGSTETSELFALEEIHALKNAVAPTGSPELLQACEKLRIDACQQTDRGALAARYAAIANAAAILVRRHRDALPPTTTGDVDHG